MRLLFLLVLSLNLFAQNGIEVKNAWIRPGAAGMNTAFYATVMNKGDKADYLVKAESAVSKVVEVHETYKKGEDMMGMREVEKIEVPAEGKLMLKPMSYHVMLIKLKDDVVMDSKHEVTLHFKNAGKITVTAKVREMPSEMMKKMKGHDPKKASTCGTGSCCGEG